MENSWFFAEAVVAGVALVAAGEVVECKLYAIRTVATTVSGAAVYSQFCPIAEKLKCDDYSECCLKT